jgi:hypothetical protein
MEKKNFWNFFLILLLLTDVCISFFQHIHFSLDGDMASIIVFSGGYTKVLHDPFGLTVLTENSIHAAPNRFFAHWFMSVYFKTAPFFFQLFSDPLDSIYLACGFAKIVIQVGLILILAMYISGKKRLIDKDVLLAAVLVTPLFQTTGYNIYMGIIDTSITYTFFYALPLGLLLIFFWPFYREYYFGESIKYSIPQTVVFLLLILILSLNGPLIPGIVLIVCSVYLTHKWWINYTQKNELPFLKRVFTSIKAIPSHTLFYFILFCLLCFYSLYIGRNNGENFAHTAPLLERYSRLPRGLFNLFTEKLGLPLLLLFILLNGYIIKKTANNPEGQKIIELLKWIGIFAIIYMLLLPMGGYREYRSNILRRDTFMPIVICMMFIYGLSTFFILKNADLKYRKVYSVGVIIFMLIFTIADNPIVDANKCEREALMELAKSNQKITLLENDCDVMCWNRMINYEHSESQAVLLKYWGVTKEERLYYQK